jgi:epoxyqueuosine reductase QueG
MARIIYGPRLRLVAVVTDAPLVPLKEPILTEEENPVCKGCTICIDVCPKKILEPYQMTNSLLCNSDSRNMFKKHDYFIPCDLSIKLCHYC